MMTARPMKLCEADATLGMLFPPVRPRAEGSTLSRPREYMYRHTAVWKASAAANSEVMNRNCAAVDSPLLPRPNSSPGPSDWVTLTTWLVPTLAVMDQLTPA